MKKLFVIGFTALHILSGCGTGRIERTGDPGGHQSVLSTMPSVSATPSADTDVIALCHELSEIGRIPFRENTIAGDPVYDGLMSARMKAVPCLVDEITNETEMKDPREAPHIPDFKVGDAAVFMLHRITGVPIPEILPKYYAKEWETQGIYSYFKYVERPESRKKIQVWWRDWLQRHLDR